AVEWRCLLERMPVLLVGRDHSSEDVLVRPVLIRAVVPGPALLDANAADEAHALELLEADHAGGTRLRAQVVGFESERAVQDRLQRAAVDVRGLGVTIGGAGQDPALEQLAPLIRAISDGELADKHFAAAILRTREHAVLTGIAGANVKHKRRGGAVRDDL